MEIKTKEDLTKYLLDLEQKFAVMQETVDKLQPKAEAEATESLDSEAEASESEDMDIEELDKFLSEG